MKKVNVNNTRIQIEYRYEERHLKKKWKERGFRGQKWNISIKTNFRQSRKQRRIDNKNKLGFSSRSVKAVKDR